jgi:3-isopropylmalate dehydrogenase
MKATIVLLPGDGIGPEVVREARATLETVAERFGHELLFSEHVIGGAAIDLTGTPLPPRTIEACEAADAVLLGAVGGPKWDDPRAKVRPEQGLLGIRRALGLYANVRPVRPYAELATCSPLRAPLLAEVDLVVVRELTGGLYFGQPRLRETKDGVTRAVDTLEYTDAEIRRVARVAFELASRRRRVVTSVDKANVLESSRLWRETVTEVARDFPGVRLEHQLVDSCAMRLITHARSFDVIVTENMFGDILTDEASMLAGSLGLLPSASLGANGRGGLFEPIHGSAPDIAGKGIANPYATILSAAMLLRYSLKLEAEALALEAAVSRAVVDGKLPADIAAPGVKPVSTRAAGDAVLAALK